MSTLDEIIKKTQEKPVKKIEDIRKTIDEKKLKTYKPVISPETTFTTKEEREKIVNKELEIHKKKHGRMKLKEKKLITDYEKDPVKSNQNTVIILAVIGLMFIIGLKTYLPEEAYFIIIILIGSFMFIPTGMIIGWITLDPVMRCKILRKTTRQNYGLVHFVGKGDKIITKIKNFDRSLIWRQNDCWVLSRDRIYQITKDGEALNDGNYIDPKAIISIVETVPILFVDMDSMEPLKIFDPNRVAVSPSEIGPSLKAWADNQKAKMIAKKEMADILMYIAIIAAIAAAALSYQNMTQIQEIAKSLGI